MSIRLFALVLTLLAPLSTFAVEADSILGKWVTGSDYGKAHIEIYKDAGKYSGKLVWLEKPVFPEKDPLAGKPKVDRKNPDPALRTRPVLGLVIVQGLEYAGNGNWKNGTLYAPDNGKTYRFQGKLGEDGVLHVRGFVGFSLFGRSMDWPPVK